MNVNPNRPGDSAKAVGTMKEGKERYKSGEIGRAHV